MSVRHHTNKLNRRSRTALRAALTSVRRRKHDVGLLVGALLMVVGLMSFESGRYCNGSPHDTYACVNPDTYYYYPVWTIVAVALGVLLLLLWWRTVARRPSSSS